MCVCRQLLLISSLTFSSTTLYFFSTSSVFLFANWRAWWHISCMDSSTFCACGSGAVSLTLLLRFRPKSQPDLGFSSSRNRLFSSSSFLTCDHIPTLLALKTETPQTFSSLITDFIICTLSNSIIRLFSSSKSPILLCESLRVSSDSIS